MAISQYTHMTTAGAGAKNGIDWDNALDLAARVATPPIAGEVCFIKEGSYTLLANLYFSTAGTSVNPVALIGVKAATTNVGAAITDSDWSTDTDRPSFDCGSYTFRTANFYTINNIITTSDANNYFICGGICQYHNVKIIGDYAASIGTSIVNASLPYCIFDKCYFLSPKSRLVGSAAGNRFINCLFDAGDATNGIGIAQATTNSLVVLECTFKACSIAIQTTSSIYSEVCKNTFYNCGIGIESTTGYGWLIKNNLFYGSTTADMSWGTQEDSNFIWGNHGVIAGWANIDKTTVYQDYEVTAGDPLFANAAGGDFSLLGGSPCLGTARDMMLGVGTPVISGNRGASQGFPEALRNTDPGEANVKNAETYKILNVDKTGSYTVAVQAFIPPMVRL